MKFQGKKNVLIRQTSFSLFSLHPPYLGPKHNLNEGSVSYHLLAPSVTCHSPAQNEHLEIYSPHSGTS